MGTAHSFTPVTFGTPAWERSSPRKGARREAEPSRRVRPVHAAFLMAAAGAVLVAGCCLAAWLDSLWSSAAAVLGFAFYLFLFVRGLDELPVNWESWRERNYDECDECDECDEDPDEGGGRNRGSGR